MSELLSPTQDTSSEDAESPAVGVPRRRALRRAPRLVQAMAVLVAGYLLVLLLAGGTGAAAAMTHASFAVFPGLAAVACLTAARSLPVEQRRTWGLIAAAMVTYACGGLVWVGYSLRGLPVPVPSLGEVGFLGYVLPLSAGLLVLPIASRSRLSRTEIVM